MSHKLAFKIVRHARSSTLSCVHYSGLLFLLLFLVCLWLWKLWHGSGNTVVVIVSVLYYAKAMFDKFLFVLVFILPGTRAKVLSFHGVSMGLNSSYRCVLIFSLSISLSRHSKNYSEAITHVRITYECILTYKYGLPK